MWVAISLLIAEVDGAIRDDGLTKPAIDLIQLAFRGSSRAIAKAHNVQSRFGEKLEVRRGTDLVGEALRQPAVPLDHRAISVATVGG